MLFWYRRGAARRLRGAIDGRRIDHAFAGNLALFPADMEIDGEFRLGVSAVESAGQMPHRYLISQRIEKAKQLLAHSSDSITE